MVYGPGDRTFLSRIIPLLRQRKMVMLGNPDTLLPLVHVRDVVAAVMLAAASDRACGEAFNIVNNEPITQREFLNTVAARLNVPPVRTTIPYPAAYASGFLGELAGHLFRSKNAPRLTRYPVFLFGHQRLYSAAKAQKLLGWNPSITFKDGLPEAVAAFFANHFPTQSQ